MIAECTVLDLHQLMLLMFNIKYWKRYKIEKVHDKHEWEIVNIGNFSICERVEGVYACLATRKTEWSI